MAEADLRTARLRPNPNLNNQSLQVLKNSNFAENTNWNNFRNQQYWWQLTKPIQLPNQRHYKIEVARQNATLSQFAYLDSERNLLLDVGSQWLQVWLAQKKLQLVLKARTNIDTLVYINRLRFRKQVITQAELTRTELLSTQYAVQERTAQQEFKAACNQLKLMLGRNDVAGVDTSGSFSPTFSDSLTTVLQQALQNRSDINAARISLQAAAANIKLQKALAVPQPELGLIYNPQNAVPYVGFYGAIDIPVFSRNQGEIARSKLAEQQAGKFLAATQLRLETELATSYQNYLTSRRNLAATETMNKQASNILATVQYAYLHGGTTIIDFLEAQRSWFEIRQQYYELMQLYWQNYLDLLYAAGLIGQFGQ